MKKSLIALVGVIMLTSCTKDDKNSVTISRDEYEVLKNPEREYPKPFSKTEIPSGSNGNDMIVLGSDGHEYILVTSYINGFAHSPECLKCRAKDEELRNMLYQILNKKKDTLR